jgi:hypothetical protein
VLIDQEKVRSGLTADEAWKFYDLGHGYCTYDFFDQCPHRMACAKCSFYMPKGSTAAALLEGKRNLLRMRQEIPLSDAELAAARRRSLRAGFTAKPSGRCSDTRRPDPSSAAGNGASPNRGCGLKR